MNTPTQGILWLDHEFARIFPIQGTERSAEFLHTAATGLHRRHTANEPGAGHQGVDREYFGRIVEALVGYDAVLVTGPGPARLEFRNFVDLHHPDLARRIVAVQALDHPQDDELVAFGRTFFHATTGAEVRRQA